MSRCRELGEYVVRGRAGIKVVVFHGEFEGDATL